MVIKGFSTNGSQVKLERKNEDKIIRKKERSNIYPWW